jgi:hypothetical protein
MRVIKELSDYYHHFDENENLKYLFNIVNLHAVHDCDEVDEDAELIFGKPLEVICGV